MDVASSGHSWFGIVSSAQEAHALIEASKQGLLPRVTRRLTDEERLRFIRPGAVFVWEEEEASVKRWTDHIKWSPSRVSGAFLTYTEIPSRGDETLIKQSFAATGTNNARMHLIAYTSKAAFATGALPTASRDPLVQRMIGQMTSNRDPRDPAPRPPPGPIASTSQRTPPPPLYSYLTHPSPTQKLPTKLSPTEPNHPSHLSQRFASSSSSAPPARNHSPPGSTRAGILSAGTERLSAPEPHHQIRHVSSYPSLRNILNQEHSESQTRPSPSPPLSEHSASSQHNSSSYSSTGTSTPAPHHWPFAYNAPGTGAGADDMDLDCSRPGTRSSSYPPSTATTIRSGHDYSPGYHHHHAHSHSMSHLHHYPAPQLSQREPSPSFASRQLPSIRGSATTLPGPSGSFRPLPYPTSSSGSTDEESNSVQDPRRSEDERQLRLFSRKF